MFQIAKLNTRRAKCLASVFHTLMLVTLFVSLVTCIFQDVYLTLCPDHKASVYIFRQQDVLVKSRIQCVALCQQDQRCSSVTFHDNQCSLITSNESSCEERAVGQGSLERVSSSWCSHGGQLVSGDICTCPQPYAGRFCTIDGSEIDDCMTAPCQNGGTCHDGWGTFSCECPLGLVGQNCANDGSHVISTELDVYMQNMYDDGDWGSKDTCPAGSYAAGVQLEIEPHAGAADDTAVNAIKLICKQTWGRFLEVGSIKSSKGKWGENESTIYCPNDSWIVTFQLRHEPRIGNYDDVGVTGFGAWCRGPGMNGNLTEYIEHRMDWVDPDEWSSWSPNCPQELLSVH